MKKRELILTILLTTILLTTLISAEKIGIEILDNKENYSPGDNVLFKITIYDDSLNKLDGKVNFKIENYYKDIIQEGMISSGEEINFELPRNAIKGFWRISTNYNELNEEILFNVLEYEKLDIKLEENNLIISNFGNVPIIAKQISISIGDSKETALVSLDVGQEKKVKLTAPPGEYNIKVSDGTNENTFEIKSVPLTGNVIGLEGEGGFWKDYPMVSLFLSVLFLVVIVITTIKIYQKISKK